MPSHIRRLLNRPSAWLIALVCYWLALFVATHLPAQTPVLPGRGFDKVAHVAAFAVLALLLAGTWQTFTGRTSRRTLVGIWIVLVLYAAVDEWTQGFVGRHPSVLDWLADAAGAALGLTIFLVARRFTRPR